MLKYAITAVAVAIALTGCAPAAKAPPAPPESASQAPSSAIDPAAITAQLNNATGGIKSLCSGARTHWSCFFDSITRHNDSAVKVNLTTDGAWSDADLDEMAEAAGLHVFNFVGAQNPNLDYVVVYVNGIDRATVYRRDVPLLNR